MFYICIYGDYLISDVLAYALQQQSLATARPLKILFDVWFRLLTYERFNAPAKEKRRKEGSETFALP